MAVRESIRNDVRSNGADIHGDLTKSVTHLVAAAAEGKKYEAARHWNIKVVGYEWLQESIQRGMVLEESLYDPILAPQDRGKGAWKKLAETATLGKRTRDDGNTVDSATSRRKLRRAMSSKLESQQETIWADIASASSDKPNQDEWQAPDMDSVYNAARPQGENSGDLTPDPTVEPFQKKRALSESNRLMNPDTKARSLFQAALVYIHGFDAGKTGILQDHLLSHGARVCTKATSLSMELCDSRNGFVLVPHDGPSDQLVSLPALAGGLELATEWWLECCIAMKTLVNPNNNPLCRPFTHLRVDGKATSIRLVICGRSADSEVGFKGMTICSTGFKGVHLLHVTKVIDLMGIFTTKAQKDCANVR